MNYAFRITPRLVSGVKPQFSKKKIHFEKWNYAQGEKSTKKGGTAFHIDEESIAGGGT